MTRPPVLKPKEVVAILEKLGLRKCGSADPKSNIDTLMVVAQQSLFMPAGIFFLYCADK